MGIVTAYKCNVHLNHGSIELDSAIKEHRLYINDAPEQPPGLIKVTNYSPQSQDVTLMHGSDPIQLADAISLGILYFSNHCLKCGSGAQHEGCVHCRTGGKSRHPRSRSRHPRSRSRSRSRHYVSTKRRRRRNWIKSSGHYNYSLTLDSTCRLVSSVPLMRRPNSGNIMFTFCGSPFLT